MDKKRIIEEGLLEQYLLGELSPDQQALVEDTLVTDPTLMAQCKAIEEDFERMAFENAINPPKSVRKSLQVKVESKASENKVRSIEKPEEKPVFNKSRLLVAASLAAIFALSSFWLYNQWQTVEENLRMVREETSALRNRLADLEKNYQETNNKYNTINNPNVTPLLLVGNEKLPNSKVIAYVNHKAKEVVVNPQGLPTLESSKTYQMWADVDGEMIDMGIVPTDKDLVALKYIDKAESLNITIEPAGGNDHPTVENLISNIYL